MIHSRACWLETYKTDGREPSFSYPAFLVTLSAMIDWPLTLLPMVSSLVMPGYFLAMAVYSSLRPPFWL